MMFIELTGAALLQVISGDEAQPDDLRAIGVRDESIVRVNQQGDIELRREDRWDVIGGLLGDFAPRLKKATGLDWAE